VTDGLQRVHGITWQETKKARAALREVTRGKPEPAPPEAGPLFHDELADQVRTIAAAKTRRYIPVPYRTQDEIRTRRQILARAEPAPPITPEEETGLTRANIAHIRPLASPTFGGMPAAIAQAEPYERRGYLLRPHRGACREAWLNLKHCEVQRAGRVLWAARQSRLCPTMRKPRS
jgi:hypothetical protein